KTWLFASLRLGAASAAGAYWLEGDIVFDSQRPFVSAPAVAHGSALLGLLFAVKAFSYWLDRFHLLYGDNGVVVGASYTDVHLQLPVPWFLILVAAAGALAGFENFRRRGWRLPAAALATLVASSLLLGGLVPGLFQRIYVKPNELLLETPYLKNNIALTQQAYNLHQITVKPFAVEQSLTAQA